MPAAVRRLLGLLIVLSAIPLALSTPWAKSLVFERAIAWARGRFGVDIRASRFDYRLFSLSVSAEDLTIADAATPQQPVLHAARLDVDLAGSALGGRLAFDGIAARDVRLAIDTTARQPRQEGTAQAGPVTLPPFSIDRLDLEHVDFQLTDDDFRVNARDITASLAGFRRADELSGTLTAAGGVEVSFDTDAIRVTFDRAEARVALENRSSVRTSLTASSAVGKVTATGRVPFSLDAPLDLDYEGGVVLERLRDWWTDAPEWNGRPRVTGRVTGALRSPSAAFHVEGRDLAWSALQSATMDASGGVSVRGLDVASLSAASRGASLSGNGHLAFRSTDRSEFSGRWTGVGFDVIASLFDRSFVAASPSFTNGTASITWPGLRPDITEVQGRAEASARARAPDQMAAARLEASAGEGRWRFGYRQLLDGGTSALVNGTVAVDGRHFARSSVQGSVRIDASDIGHAVTQLNRLGIGTRLDFPVASARVAFEGTLSGTIAAPRASGTIDAAGVSAGPIDNVALQGTIAVDAQAVHLTPLIVTGGRNRAELNGDLPWQRGNGNGTVTAHVEDPALFAPGVPDAWKPRGVIDLAGSWTGTLRDLAAGADLKGREVAVNGIAFQSLTANTSIAGGRLVVSDLNAAQPGGTLSGRGEWDLANRTMNSDLVGRTLDVAIDAPAGDNDAVTKVRGDDVSFEAHLAGPAERPDGSLTWTATTLAVGGRETSTISGSATLAEGRAQVNARAPAFGATLDGTVTLDSSLPFQGRVSFDESNVAALAQLAGAEAATLSELQVSVTGTVEAHGSGRELASAEATVSLTRVAGTLREMPLNLEEAGRFHLADRRIAVEAPLRLTWGGTSLRVGAPESSGPGIAVTLDGPVADVVTLAADRLPADLSAEGGIRADFRLNTSIDDLQPAGALDLELASLKQGQAELARDLTMRAESDGDRIHVTNLRGIVLDGEVDGEGEAPLSWLGAGNGDPPATEQPASFRISSKVVLGSVWSLLRPSSQPVTGTLALTTTGTATAPRLEAVRATVRGEGGTLTAGAFTLNSEGGTAIRLEDGRVHLDGFRWKGPDSELKASGALGLVDGVDGTMRLDGDASLGLLTLFIPARVDGRARFNLEVSGPPGARAMVGTIDLADGTVVVPEWRLSMADWSGSLTLDAEGIEARGIHGQFNGGDATVEGRLPFRSKGADRITARVRSAFLDVPKGLRSQLDADLQWSRQGEISLLSGTATLTARTYREPITEVARLASSLIDNSNSKTTELPAALAATQLDVRLSTVGPLAITNSVASVEMTPDLQLTGTVAQPALRGQVAVAEDGRIQFGGRQYRLRESRLEFSPEQGLVPQLAVSGETRVGDYTVSLRLSGAVNQIETALSSDPPLGERDLQTLLVTGQLDDPTRGGTKDENAVGAVSGDVLGFAGQFLGFDSVTVGTTDDLALVSSDVDPALRLTVSKRLGRRFELVLSDNLDDNELTWVIIYRPRPGFEFRVISRDNTEFTGEFRQEIFFGPGVSAPRPTPRRRQSRERVGVITVTGYPGFTTAEVLAATSLRLGDRFEFERWLDDRDRIARLYRERGYLAARIVPTRQDVTEPDGSHAVGLTYRIVRGPETVLTVEGYAAPAALLDRLRLAWAESVLLELLDTDLERVMREHLVNEGYLRATLGVAVDHTDVERRITATITVDPGARTTERRVAFIGNHAIDEKTLLADATRQQLIASAWLDPAPLVSWVESTFVARGYLAVKVAARPIAHAGSVATLPLVITEGTLSRIATVRIDGTRRIGEAEALKATGVGVGQPYLAGSEQAARQALERHYRNLGYRDVKVSADATVHAGEGTVDLALSLVEGPQYVVASVQTTGLESTRDSLVDRATRIEPGVPASPSLAESTRRRLYDIGTFRSANVTFEPVTAAPATDTVPVNAVVSLQESKRFLFLYGFETTNQYQSLFDQRVTTAGVAADLRDRNFLGRGWSLGAGVSYEPSFDSVRLLMTVPRFASTRIRTNFYANAQSEERARSEQAIFRDDETNITIEQRWRPRQPIELSWGYRYNARTLRFLDANTRDEGLRFKYYLASLASAIVIDRRNSQFDAKRGWLLSATGEWGLQPLGSDFDYLRTLVRGSHYLPFGPLTLASNVRWGNLVQLEGQPPLTVLDIFFTAGGTQTVRGFKQDSLSAYYVPYKDANLPVGGPKLLIFNEELRFPLFWLLSGAAFVDAGNTFTDRKGIAFDDFAVGTGLGLRIRTPLAPVRIDVGFPVRSDTGQTSFRWHFSIGQIF